MEKELRALFDYQRFEPNSLLASLIEEMESRYPATADGVELADDDLMMLNAAGVPSAGGMKDKGEVHHG